VRTRACALSLSRPFYFPFSLVRSLALLAVVGMKVTTITGIKGKKGHDKKNCMHMYNKKMAVGMVSTIIM